MPEKTGKVLSPRGRSRIMISHMSTHATAQSTLTARSYDSNGILNDLQREAWGYFERNVNPLNGLVADRAPLSGGLPDSIPCSIAAVGFALACYPVAIERGFVRRNQASKLALNTLRFFCESEQSRARDATGYRGFSYHFLDMKQGRRFPLFKRCEISTIDTALLLAGALAAARYFDHDTSLERELRERAETLARRVDWHWALQGDEVMGEDEGAASTKQSASLESAPHAVSHGWTPERGFLRARWLGYNEALILYVLGLGSPSFALPVSSYEAWTETYRWKTIYNRDFLYCGSFFVHQFSHCWIDFKGIRDAPMSTHASDYFQNSHHATMIQHQYAKRNPRGFRDYDENNWGICAGDGPGEASRDEAHNKAANGEAAQDEADRKPTRFYGYRARGVPFGVDDGTLAPWSTVAALPFAPSVVLPFIEHAAPKERAAMSTHGGAFNDLLLTRNANFRKGWRADQHFALALGPIVLMIENHRSGLLWELMRGSRHIENGLRRANFNGGWLDAQNKT